MPVLPRQVAALIFPAVLAAAAATAAAEAPEPAFAVVDNTVITAAQFDAALQSTMRQKYFHRQVPEPKLREFEREVAGQLIERSLLVAEGRRHGLSVDRARIDAIAAEYDARYAATAAWQDRREALLASLRRELEERDLVEQLRAAVQSVSEPSESELRDYYAAHAEHFVEPAQSRVSVTVVTVDAAAPGSAWRAAETEARALRDRLLESGDFSALRDLGYLHDGMLPQAISERLDALTPGELSEPIRVLEGVALVRMVEKKAARAQPFDEARARAVQLWQREQGAQRWQALVESLRRAATIRIDLARYPALSGIAP